jgi:3-phenylpropionate/trans-cinnamate dioxygenase ferredoxin reductase component
MNSEYDILIAGGGHGGTQAATALRQYGFDGSIAIVSAEDAYPYQRPPLSKAYLEGAVDVGQILIRPASYWADHGIDLVRGRRIDAVDPAQRLVTTDDGAATKYRTLIWATGSTPRALDCPGWDLAGIHLVRSLSDVDRLRADLASASAVVIVGGGYIGLEAAAVLRKLGKQVTVVEAFSRVLARVSADPISRFYQAQHEERGVELRMDSNVTGFEGAGGQVRAIRLADGEVIPADVAIVSVGVVPSAEPLIVAGAIYDNGVLVDGQCRTSLPDVYAIGDCTASPTAYADGAVVRLESVQNAVDQGSTVARRLSGKPEADPAVPSFWSDQYDLRLRTIGLSHGYDDAVVRGDPTSRSFSVVYLKSGRVIAVDSVNAAKDFARGRALVRSAARIDVSGIADTSRPLDELVIHMQDLDGREVRVDAGG